jgi:hypothetical protein
LRRYLRAHIRPSVYPGEGIRGLDGSSGRRAGCDPAGFSRRAAGFGYDLCGSAREDAGLDPGPWSGSAAFSAAQYAQLPEVGRLTGRGNTVNLENVVRLAPDLVLDVDSTTATYVSLADQVQSRRTSPQC